jgi:MFS family permease
VQLIAILMNVANVAVTLLSAVLMDRAGRRALLLVSTHAMLLGTGLLTLALSSPGQSYTTSLSVCAVVLFVTSFGTRTTRSGTRALKRSQRRAGARSATDRFSVSRPPAAAPLPPHRARAGIGLGPIAWLLPAEILPTETRALAYSVAASTNWLAYFIATQVFLTIANALGSFAFVPFAVCLAVGGGFVMLVVPETKGKSLEQIQCELAFGGAPCC